jgi:hypothetical protein
MARWNSPDAAGTAINVATLLAPADTPPIVTCRGSPPNAAMLSRTHRSAAIWSSTPQLVSSRKPKAPNR